MEQHERVLRRIDQVLELEASPEVAYPLRARLGRALNEAAELLATSTFHADLARSLRARAGRIMQPSEPFDGVWQGEWSHAMEELRALRNLVVTLPN